MKVKGNIARLAFCKETLTFGLVAAENKEKGVTKLWTPIGVIETVQLTVIIIKSLWDLYKLLRMIWKEYKGAKGSFSSAWNSNTVYIGDILKNTQK